MPAPTAAKSAQPARGSRNALAVIRGGLGALIVLSTLAMATPAEAQSRQRCIRVPLFGRVCWNVRPPRNGGGGGAGGGSGANVPEIDPGTARTAAVLLVGGVALLASRRRR